jgi:arginyl-tRNA synthetase
LALAKELGQQPRQVAEAVLAQCGGLTDICSSVEVAGPGFLNLVFNNQFLAGLLKQVSDDPRLGIEGGGQLGLDRRDAGVCRRPRR